MESSVEWHYIRINIACIRLIQFSLLRNSKRLKNIYVRLVLWVCTLCCHK